MTFTPLDEINLALVMSQELLMAWAATLAITTFIPLVQIAAVKMYASSAAPDPAQDATPTVQRRKRNVEPDDAGATNFVAPVRIVHASNDAVHTTGVADALHIADARTQALQMHAEGMTATQIARALHANANTVRSWLRRA